MFLAKRVLACWCMSMSVFVAGFREAFLASWSMSMSVFVASRSMSMSVFVASRSMSLSVFLVKRFLACWFMRTSGLLADFFFVDLSNILQVEVTCVLHVELIWTCTVESPLLDSITDEARGSL